MSMRSFSGYATLGVLEIQILKNCHAGRRELSPHRTGTCRCRAESHGTTGHSQCNFQEQEQPHCAESVSRNPRRRGQRRTEAGCSTERECCNSPIRCHRNHWSSFPFHQYVEGAKRRRLDELRGGGVNESVSRRAGHGTVCS